MLSGTPPFDAVAVIGGVRLAFAREMREGAGCKDRAITECGQTRVGEACDDPVALVERDPAMTLRRAPRPFA
jgi:hypothetical protein